MKKIKIDGLSQDKTEYGIKVTIVSGKDKFIFYNTKKDGTTSRAFDQYQRFGFSIGDTVEAEVKEEPKQFINKEKKEVKYMQKKIIYFQEAETARPLTKPTVTNIDSEIKSEDLPF